MLHNINVCLMSIYFLYIFTYLEQFERIRIYIMMPREYCCFDFNASSKSPAKLEAFFHFQSYNYNPWQQSDEVNA